MESVLLEVFIREIIYDWHCPDCGKHNYVSEDFFIFGSENIVECERCAKEFKGFVK